MDLREIIGAAKDKTAERHIAYDSRHCVKNSIFVAIEGEKADGSDYIENAVEKGATIVIYDKSKTDVVKNISEKYKDVVFIPSENTRLSLAEASSVLYDDSSRDENIVAVCGTNGKTTTTYLIRSVFESAGKKSALIGTIKNIVGDETFQTKHTTPESADLQKIFFDMKNNGVVNAVMEASSHALTLSRCDYIHFDSVIFTNFTEDHLDFHKTMDEYFLAKMKAFDLLAKSGKKNKKAFINIHTERFDEIKKYLDSLKIEMITYGLTDKADYWGEIKSMNIKGIQYLFYHKGKLISDVNLALIGEFNVLNSLSALSYANEYGYDINKAVAKIKDVRVDGRFEIVTDSQDPFTVAVDYAHTPDGLINILSSAKKLQPKRIITVFGCGGDRDRKKRPLMAEAVQRYSDIFFLTLDNPRTESFDQIMNDIEKGISDKSKCKKILSRKIAIEEAVREAKEGDIVIIAGKGHETYQLFKNKTIDFDDRKVAREALSKIYH